MKIKNLIIGIAVLLIVGATILFVTYSQNQQSGNPSVSSTAVYKGKNNADYLRIHVRANSNEQIDQDVKYKVKDEIVKFITPYAAECTDKQAAMKIIGGILEVANKVLAENGFDYKSRASVRTEEFPTRVYGDTTLEAGLYDALIVELGSGTGDNWWCVIYPPLCFTAGTAQVQYRSAIYDIINKFFN